MNRRTRKIALPVMTCVAVAGGVGLAGHASSAQAAEACSNSRDRQIQTTDTHGIWDDPGGYVTFSIYWYGCSAPYSTVVIAGHAHDNWADGYCVIAQAWLDGKEPTISGKACPYKDNKTFDVHYSNVSTAKVRACRVKKNEEPRDCSKWS